MERFEQFLASVLSHCFDSTIKEASYYSLLAGGKRVRPRLLLATLQAYGIDEEIGYPAASSIEMIHTYSLIHDDLPAMDNDTLRRGKPTCHVQFNEGFAILAGDALLTHAFEVLTNATFTDKIKVELVRELASHAGLNGMIYGQELDILNENNISLTQDELMKIHNYKTGCLIQIPLVMAAIIAQRYEDISVLSSIGRKLGLLFQVQDDVFDVIKTSEELGKNALSDAEKQKCTYVTLLGQEACEELIHALYAEILEALESISFNAQPVKEVFEFVLKRNH